ncbi:hypothetical protein LTR78_003797 [Recurvomyces mirabilis]|uniref:Myb-like DNA-binding domain-containing protein n=1 Tax=Recurvomyces mirabilis TaxID=574656 RepID=A0AAE0WR80_9PEZI|nr:hypothetical protein LTR78_003797 [Recurvomyces mirabilis]KAK5154909.1 hypothetical protein LTS14_006490 [Recurvomyces mirabilis]
MSYTNEHFLFCVLDHTVSGKTDWKAVGDVFGIKVGAASMRFWRLKTKFGDYASAAAASPAKASGQQTPRKEIKSPSTKFTPSKKRKTQDDVDDEEMAASHSRVKEVKAEAAAKEESEDDGWA